MENFLIIGNMYGFGNLNRPIQSVDGFIGSAWKINAGQYFLLFFCGKLFAAAVFVGVIIWICLRGKNILRTSIALILLTGIEWALYTGISPNSWLSILRWCNLFSFIRTENFFQTYETVNLFSYPVSSVIVLYTGISPNSWLSILRWCNLFSFIRTENFFQTYETVNLFSYPVSSVIVCSITGAILFLLCIVQSILCYEKVSRGEYAQKKEWKKLQRRKILRGQFYFCFASCKVFYVMKR